MVRIRYDFGTDWTGATTFNDDVMWACLAFRKAYFRTGDSSLAGLAADNFNYVYNGGGHCTSPGIMDNTSAAGAVVDDGPQFDRFQKCLRQRALARWPVLAPYQIYGSSTSFLKQSQNMYNWEKSHLFDDQPPAGSSTHENENGVGWRTSADL